MCDLFFQRSCLVVFSAAKPRITVQPQSQEAVSGQEFSLSVEVDSSSSSGPSPSTSSYQCSFQWFKNYSHLHGKTDPKLLIASAVESDTGEYYCTAFNKGGSTDSDIAFVKVSNPHPCPLVLEGAPPTHRGLSYWSTGEGARNPKVPSLGNRSVSVGGVSGVRIGQFGGAGGVEGVIRAGFVGEISRPRSWAEEGGVLGGAGLGVGLPPVEGLIGRSGSISGGGGGRRVGSSYLTRKGSGASGVLGECVVLYSTIVVVLSHNKGKSRNGYNTVYFHVAAVLPISMLL